MSEFESLKVAYAGKIDVDVIAEQDYEEKVRRTEHRKTTKALLGFLQSSDIFRICGGDFTLLIYLLKVMAGDITQVHIDKAQALREAASLKFPLLPKDKKLEYLRIELRQAPSAVLMAMLERDGFKDASDPKGKLSVYYGEACLADYKQLISWPNIVLPCDIAPETVNLPTAPTADTRTGGVPETGVSVTGDDSSSADAFPKASPRMRIDKLHDTPQLKTDYRDILTQCGEAAAAEIGEALALKYKLKKLKTATIQKLESTLDSMVLDGELIRDPNKKYRVKTDLTTISAPGGSETLGQTPRPPSASSNGGMDRDRRAQAFENVGQAFPKATRERTPAADPDSVGAAARQPDHSFTGVLDEDGMSADRAARVLEEVD